jgi:serine/threonine protein kinase
MYCGSSVEPGDATCGTCGANLSGVHLTKKTQLGGYVIHSVLGQGGFGITYRAKNSGRGEVAIKEFFPDGSTRVQQRVVPPSGITATDFLEMRQKFLEEAHTLERFMRGSNHPHIVDVFEVFEANNTAYMVMELLEGQTLEARIQKLGKLKAAEVRDIADDLCKALEAVHGERLLHRDIKPANVFLTDDGRAVLLDFGSARAFTAGRTMRHTRMVTPGYAPLEQYSSEARVSSATDVYALSATLYHALTGNAPPTALDRMNGAKLKPLKSNFSAGMRQAIEQGLSLQIADRPADAKAFVALVKKRNPQQVVQSRVAKFAQKSKLQQVIQPRVVTPGNIQTNLITTPPWIQQWQNSFWDYNWDFRAFLNWTVLAIVLFSLSFLLRDIFRSWWLVVFFGLIRMLFFSFLACVVTALAELPFLLLNAFGVAKNMPQPLNVVRRIIIFTIAMAVAFLVLGFELINSPFSTSLIESPFTTMVSLLLSKPYALFVPLWLMLWYEYRTPSILPPPVPPTTSIAAMPPMAWTTVWDGLWIWIIAVLLEWLGFWARLGFPFQTS